MTERPLSQSFWPRIARSGAAARLPRLTVSERRLLLVTADLAVIGAALVAALQTEVGLA